MLSLVYEYDDGFHEDFNVSEELTIVYDDWEKNITKEVCFQIFMFIFAVIWKSEKPIRDLKDFKGYGALRLKLFLELKFEF